MSQSIWTRCAGSSEVRPLRFDPWRVVESQTLLSTRKLVDSDEEQDVLERLLERVKPAWPALPRLRALHFLLSTPFRHPPPPRGSRFGTRLEPGIWYGSETLPTALAEVAYYRYVFLEGTVARLGTVTTEVSAFQAAVRTPRGVDLTAAPFDAHAARISSPTSYAASQRLGADMRAAGVEGFFYRSARDPGRGRNVGLFAPAFARRTPSAPATWVCTTGAERVEFRKKDALRPARLAFPRAVFLVRGQLPTPAL